MNYLGFPEEQLETAGGGWTAREIAQQPAVWERIALQLAHDADALRAFLGGLLRRPELRIVLTGAGTSAFVGECIAPAMVRRSGARVDAVATTDLVGSPDSWLARDVPTLLVSFARSGNSPESVAALESAEKCVRECHHLIITCNAEGTLYRLGQTMRNAHVVLLPPETNDRGFAMTSSFSGMLLAAALTFSLISRDAGGPARNAGGPVPLARWGSEVLRRRLPLIQQLASAGFERVVYLGSNELKGLAREAALKLLELSDGKVVAVAETPLGFRHGPKTIVNRGTLVVLFLCNDPYTRRYEIDLLNELRADGAAGRVIALSGSAVGATCADDIVLPGGCAAVDLELIFPYAVFAQTLAFLSSLALGLRPDTPNAAGFVNRVVQGVSIYPWQPT